MRLSTRGSNVLDVTVESARGVVTVRCQGRLVRGQETALLCGVIQQHGREIILDLSGVTAIDAAGIGALVSLQVAGTYLRLVGPSSAVRQVLRLTSLDSVFEISESECSEETVGLEPQKAERI
jgi:anti-anti-sigma factor